MRPDLDIVVYAVAAKDASTASKAAREVFSKAALRQLHLAMIEVPAMIVSAHVPGMHMDTASVTCLRSVLMNPEHQDWLDDIMRILESIAAA